MTVHLSIQSLVGFWIELLEDDVEFLL